MCVSEVRVLEGVGGVPLPLPNTCGQVFRRRFEKLPTLQAVPCAGKAGRKQSTYTEIEYSHKQRIPNDGKGRELMFNIGF